MRVDMDGLVFMGGHPAMDIDRVSDLNAWEHAIVQFVAHGSGNRSPFLHFSTSKLGAYQYAQLGQEKRCERPEDQVMIRVNIWDMYGEGLLDKHTLIDISTTRAQNRVLHPSPY